MALMKSPLVPCRLWRWEQALHTSGMRMLLRWGCETALCCDAAALKSLKGPTVQSLHLAYGHGDAGGEA